MFVFVCPGGTLLEGPGEVWALLLLKLRQVFFFIVSLQVFYKIYFINIFTFDMVFTILWALLLAITIVYHVIPILPQPYAIYHIMLVQKNALQQLYWLIQNPPAISNKKTQKL